MSNQLFIVTLPTLSEESTQLITTPAVRDRCLRSQRCRRSTTTTERELLRWLYCVSEVTRLHVRAWRTVRSNEEEERGEFKGIQKARDGRGLEGCRQ